jgi:hypothetical protein
LASGRLKGKGLNDIRTYPDRYNLTPKERLWVDQAHAIEQRQLEFLQEAGIDINLLTFEEGGRWAGRRVFGKFNPDGELLDIGYGSGPGRPGAKLGLEKRRIFESEQEGIEAGYRYMSQEDSIFLNLQGAYNRVADKNAADWLLERVDWRTTSAPEGLKIAAEQAVRRREVAERAIQAIQRAKRGENLPTGTIKSIEKMFPELQGQLSPASRITLDDLIRAGKEAAEPPTVLPVPHPGTLKKLQKLLDDATRKTNDAPGNAALRTEAARLARQLGFAKYRFKLGEPFVLEKNPVKLLRGIQLKALDEMLGVIRGTPTPGVTSTGRKTTRFKGGLLGKAKEVEREAVSARARAFEAAQRRWPAAAYCVPSC